MARGVNKVILVGNLGQDPEVRYMPNGNGVANISIATTDSWKDKNTGQLQERTEWHRVVLFGKLAEVAGEYLRKGSQVYIEGRLQTRKWTDQSGQDKYTTEIVVDMGGQMQMLGGRGEQQGQGGQYQANSKTTLVSSRAITKRRSNNTRSRSKAKIAKRKVVNKVALHRSSHSKVGSSSLLALVTSQINRAALHRSRTLVKGHNLVVAVIRWNRRLTLMTTFRSRQRTREKPN